jgi:hypothetical protein
MPRRRISDRLVVFYVEGNGDEYDEAEADHDEDDDDDNDRDNNNPIEYDLPVVYDESPHLEDAFHETQFSSSLDADQSADQFVDVETSTVESDTEYEEYNDLFDAVSHKKYILCTMLIVLERDECTRR